MQAPEKKVMQVFIALLVGELTLQWIKSWASPCSPIHREFKNPCFIFIHRWVSELWMFVYVAVTKEFMMIFLQ